MLANGGYIARMTGSNTVGALLVDTGGKTVARVADSLRRQFGGTSTITDVISGRKAVGSSRTEVDLNGLSRAELGFALARLGGS